MKRTTKTNKEFETRSKEAALAQTKLEKAKQRQHERWNSSRIQLDTTKLQGNKTVEVITIFTSNDANIFMSTPANQQRNTTEKTNKKIDKIIQRKTNSPTKRTAEPEPEQLITTIPASSSTPIGSNITNPPQQDNSEQKNSPDERLGTDIVQDKLHTEEGQAEDEEATSSISLLNIADVEALDKNL